MVAVDVKGWPRRLVEKVKTETSMEGRLDSYMKHVQSGGVFGDDVTIDPFMAKYEKEANENGELRWKLWQYKLTRAGCRDRYATEYKSQLAEMTKSGDVRMVEGLYKNCIGEAGKRNANLMKLVATNITEAWIGGRDVAKDMVESWFTYDQNRDSKKTSERKVWEEAMAEIVVQNLWRIDYLERKERGVVKELHRRFGITHFGRYPTGRLWQQWQEKDETGEYGYWLGGYRDDNGVLYQEAQIIENFVESANGGRVKVRIIEARSKLSLARRLKYLDLQYGEKDKISFGVVSAHGDGTGKAVVLGFGSDGVVGVEDIKRLKKGGKLDRVMSYYVPKPSFAFFSCEGAKGKNSLVILYGTKTVSGGGVVSGSEQLVYPEGTSLKLRRGKNGQLFIEARYGAKGGVSARVVGDVPEVDWRKELDYIRENPEKMRVLWDEPLARNKGLIWDAIGPVEGEEIEKYLRSSYFGKEIRIRFRFGSVDDFGKGVVRLNKLDGYVSSPLDYKVVVTRDWPVLAGGALEALIRNIYMARSNYLKFEMFEEYKHQQGVIITTSDSEGTGEELVLDFGHLYPEEIEKRGERAS